jgi:hypothetical protein
MHAIMAWDGKGDLTFQVDVILSTNLNVTRCHEQGTVELAIRVSLNEMQVLVQSVLGGNGFLKTDWTGFSGIVDRDAFGCPPRGKPSAGNYETDRLFGVAGCFFGKNGFVMHNTACVILAWNIGSRDHCNDSGIRQNIRPIDLIDLGFDRWAQYRDAVKAVRGFGEIITIVGLAGHMASRAVLR